MNVFQVINNAKWIIACKIARAIIQLVVGMLSARYLGPDNYGLINYAAAVTAFAVPLMQLGFDATLVRELVRAPEKEGQIMGTSLLLNLTSALICMAGVTAFASVANRGDNTAILVCMLYSCTLMFSALEMMQHWFQYKLLSKYASVVMLCSYVIVSAYKIFLLATAKSIYWFALINALDSGIIGLLLIGIYIFKGGRLSFSLERARKMLGRSKYYILAAMMLVMIQNTDHLMLTMMKGNAVNGYYSAAITCATVVQFVYLAIIDSFRPMILSAKMEDKVRYEHNMSRLYCLTTYLALAESVAFCICARPIVWILYGEEYLPAIPVLRVLVWYLAASVMGAVRNVWILAEQKQKYLWIINLSGAVMNVLMNMVMIPMWGASGAAFASLLTQVYANFILGFILRPLRDNNTLLMQGLNPRFLAAETKNMLRLLKRRRI